MIRWTYVDPYIAFKIPELRKKIAKAYIFRALKAIVVPVSFIICLPLLALIIIGHLSQVIAKIINAPGQSITRKHLAYIDAVRETMSVEEIRHRAYGEEIPRILPNTLRTRGDS